MNDTVLPILTWTPADAARLGGEMAGALASVRFEQPSSLGWAMPEIFRAMAGAVDTSVFLVTDGSQLVIPRR